MYKLLLCFRYLRTRYLAMVCIVSVMLGVATLIVVNSVMSGFSTKLRERLHSLYSDIVIETDYEGFANPEYKMALIRSDPFLKERIAAMTPTLEIFAMLQFRYNGVPVTRQVHLMGIDPAGRAEVGGFAEHLALDEHRKTPADAFQLNKKARAHFQEREHDFGLHVPISEAPTPPGEKPAPDPPPSRTFEPQGAIVGYAIAHYRKPKEHADDKPEDIETLPCGSEVILTTVSGERLTPVYDRFVVSDYFRSEMSEYDSTYVFVPLQHLQKLRTMENRVTSLQIRLHDYERDKKAVVDRLQELFASMPVAILTWEKKQGPLLAAIGIERGILNVLLFMIIAVAGFGILAIFSMIVVEKTRDIGILKALGASNGGVLNIFLGYGLLLGFVGAAFGTSAGLLFTFNINHIEQWLAKLTGQEIFDRTIYYFNEIPTHVDGMTVLLINAGALAIAVMFSVLPALRAALLHPVRALRYE